MSKSLIIVESPAKARTINKFLGKKYTVKASMGHVRDLPKAKLGIDIENSYLPKYQTIRGRGKTIAELKKAAKKAEKIFLAPDPDREGEAIAWHLAIALNLDDGKTFRVAFNEITKKAVLKAFDEPRRISMDKVDAQQARRVLDRLVGYKLSPLLWDKIAKGLSAGRVQSVAVRLIVEREREIRAFVPEEFWKITALLKKNEDDTPFKAELKKLDGEPIERIPDKAGADSLLDKLDDHAFVVSAVEKTQKKQRPSPPYTTSLLQQQASTKLRFSARKTMMIAQQLYEGVVIGAEGSTGLITYMRTDSFRVAQEALDESREQILKNYGDKYLSEKPNTYKSAKSAQAAHEAIRPTLSSRTPESLKSYLSNDQFLVYKLVWERFMASQMTPAIFDQTNVEIQAGSLTFTASGRVLVFDGHTRITGQDKENGSEILPDMKKDDRLIRESVEADQHFTKPPPRYGEASLVRTLEKEGIGRPSTYAAIISTIQDRGYASLSERRFHATELGEIVTDQLVKHFPRLIDTGFTSTMEENLDKIEGGSLKWLEVIDEFYAFFSKDLDRAYNEMADIKKNPEPAGRDCDICGKPMVFKLNKRGRFIACSGYPDCKNTISVKDGVPVEKAKPIPTGEKCEKCGADMVIRTGRRGKFMACSAFPECKNTISLDADDKPVKLQKTGILCDKCNTEMVIKYSRRGPFLACPGFPKCRNAKPLPDSLRTKPKEIDKDCPECGKKLLIRKGRKGEFTACSGYPTCRYTEPIASPK